MNKTIEELAEQAGISFYPGQFNQVPVADVTIMDVGKFAELLIRECADLTRWQEYSMSVEQRIRLEIYHEIKEHFGVE